VDEDGNGGTLSNGATAPTLAVPPTALATTFLEVFSSSVTTAWASLPTSPPDASSKTAEGFRLQASTAADFTGTLFSSFTPNVALSTLTVDGLASNVTYYFRVASLNWNSTPHLAVLGSTLTRKATGAPPGDVAVFRVFVGSVTMNWTSVAADSGYLLEASTAANFSGTLFSSATPSGTATSLTVFALDPDTTYYLRVAAQWDGGPAYAPSLSSSTLANLVGGTAFTEVFFTSATASWTPLTAQGYQVQASTAANFTGTVLSSATPNPALSALTVSGLSVNTTYYVRVGALNWNGQAHFATAKATASLASFPALGTPPFSAVFRTSATAQWTAGVPANPAKTRYRLEASSAAFAAGTTIPSSTTFNVFAAPPGLLPNTTYAFRVTALNHNSVPSLTVLDSTATLADAPQTLAQSFTAVFETSATAVWAALPAAPPDASSKTAEGYLLEASSTNFGAAAPGGLVLSSRTPNVLLATLTAAGLVRNTTYYWRVGSLNWNSAPDYTILPATPTLAAVLTGLQQAAVFETSATLNWVTLPAAPQSASAEGYALEASSTDFGAQAPGGLTLSSATPVVGLSTLTVAGLTPNVTYYFRAGALNWAGAAHYAAAGSSATLAPPPGAPAFAGVFPGSMTVSWTPVSSSGYELQASLNASFSPTAAFSSTTAGGAAQLTLAGLA
ncbi:MAG: cell wall surface anchor family protein, partial [Elusimicrobia bacterium]